MRVSDNYLSNLLVRDLNRSLASLLKTQRQAGNLRRLSSFADDPRAVAAIQRYNELIATNDQYLRNATRARIMVDATDASLQDVSEVLMEVRELALRESSALATQQSRRAAVVDVDNLMGRLLDLLNSSVEGNYIFSGHKTATPPFARDGDTVVYQGDQGEIRAQTGPGSTHVVNIPGDVFLGSRSSSLVGTADLAPRVEATTLLADLNLGDGWEPGSIEIEDGGGATYEIDLSSCLTVGDLVATVNTATSGAVTAGVTAGGQGLTFNGTGPLTIREVADGHTAGSLGISGTADGGILNGRDVRPPLVAATNLADIDALAGSLPLGSIEVAVDGNVYTVDFSGASTMGDLVSAFNAAVPGHELQIQATTVAVVSGSPELFTVTNVGGTATATLLGIEGTGTPVRLFGVLEDLKDALNNNDKDRVRGSLTELAALEEVVYAELVRTGGRQRDFDWIDGVLRQRDERLQANLSVEWDADVAQVTTELSRAEASYQASLLVTSHLFEANLLMYLR